MTKIKTKFKQTETGLIPNGWEEIIFSEAVEINPKRDLKKSTVTKAVAMEDIQPFTKKIRNYTLKKFKGGSKFKNNDTLFARITPSLENGKTAFVDILSCNEIGFGSTEFIVLSAKKEKAIPNYVYYLSRSPEVRNIAIKSMTGTSGRQRVENNIFDTIVVLLPKIKEQKKIGKILYDLDTKIENLQQQNKILEQIAQAIFKSWFVDFDGVTKFYDTELGLIPEWWAVGSLHDLSEITSGKRPQFINKLKNNSYDIPVYGASGTMGFTDESLYENRLILTGRVGTIGLIQYVAEKCFPSDNTLVIIPTNSYFFNYVFDILSSTNFECIIKGSTQPLITQTDLKDISCAIPDEDILKKFENISNYLRMFIKLNEKSINNLVQVRDLLLPKLMSGEIRV